MNMEFLSNNTTSLNRTANLAKPFLPPRSITVNLYGFVECSGAFSILLNGLIVAAFILHAELRTAFNVYVINIAVIDLLAGITLMPAMVMLEIGPDRWPFPFVSCTVLWHWGSRVTPAANRFGHILVAANRLWALS
ncbi:hypothetical protein BV898_03016 [Hypsibius exemplaris]|uniref:G-protein coupled receptors family 1 profile domain-containing protein n=1 Tax=Hypsibius exemplaris TaxID=2072580 RepID=A0A1W0X664_HYPEX|nr:hypothetical protein BV898_03016 [Hypsibius exemplaris]